MARGHSGAIIHLVDSFVRRVFATHRYLQQQQQQQPPDSAAALYR